MYHHSSSTIVEGLFSFYTIMSRGISYKVVLIWLFGALKPTASLATIPASGQISMGALGALLVLDAP